MRVLIVLVIVLLLLSMKSCNSPIPQFTDEMNSIICIQEEI